MRHARSSPFVRPSLSAILLCGLMLVLWLAGGASRADMTGQVLVRVAATVTLVLAALFGPRPKLGSAWPVAALLTVAIALALLQLVPLPPAVWRALPGRVLLEEAATISGQAQPWRPWSMVPWATANAAASLVVPVAVLVLVLGLRADEQRLLPGLLLALAALSMLVGLLQFSGGGYTNTLVNATPGTVSGTFANRNHFALSLALGCLLVPWWMFPSGQRPLWRSIVGTMLFLLFLLTILASGSRAGMALGVLSLAIGGIVSRRRVAIELQRYPRWAVVSLFAGLAVIVGIAVLVSVTAGRAVSIERAMTLDPGQDMRSLGLPTVLRMIDTYFPMGSGLGGFDPMFRLHEPFSLLKPTYFNHAHNDFLEILLDAGVAGLVLVAIGLGWWLRASVRAWKGGTVSANMVPKLGSAMLLFVFLASIFDYPARTPMVMAIMVVAALWLTDGWSMRGRSALPGTGRHL